MLSLVILILWIFVENDGAFFKKGKWMESEEAQVGTWVKTDSENEVEI